MLSLFTVSTLKLDQTKRNFFVTGYLTRRYDRLSYCALAASIITILLALALSGCSRVSQPWAGIPYESPSVIQSRGQTFYSPAPEILPAQVASPPNTNASDAMLEKTLFGDSN